MNAQQSDYTPEEIQNMFERITDGLNIGGNTFALPENQKKESIQIMKEMVADLEELLKNINPSNCLSQYNKVNNKIMFLQNIRSSIVDGEYFASINDVLDVDSITFQNADVNLFNRTYDGATNQQFTTYRETVEGACDLENGVTSKSVRSSLSNTRLQVDIFGYKGDAAQSAHLMPHSPQCSSLWFHFVPLILCRMEDVLADVRCSNSLDTLANPNITGNTIDDDAAALAAKWDFLQKCIHGFSTPKNAPSKLESKKKRAVSTETTGNIGTCNPKKRTSNSSVETNNGGVEITDADQGSNVSSSVSKRKCGVGIKHFESNRIMLQNQETYYDKLHCLLILPIMELDGVKSWEGKGYSAIVLAGKGKQLDAANVYTQINAHRGTLDFASNEDCEKAVTLLKDLIPCVCKSLSSDMFTEEFIRIQMIQHYRTKKQTPNPEDLPIEFFDKTRIHVPVPTMKDWNNFRVRKITFSNYNDDKNPAPDPMLLLAKAASNWLKLQDLKILPGWNGGDDDDSSDSSDFIASVREEAAIRGWITTMNEKPQDIVVKKRHLASDTFDESLSDYDDNE